MRSLVRRLRDGLFQVAGIDPTPVIATLHLGDRQACSAMDARMRELLPQYRHIAVHAASASEASTILKAALRHCRTGMIAALPEGWPAALRNAPLRTMAFNHRGENWAIDWRKPISSVLFLRGVALDRITLRPDFWPGKRKRTFTPDKVTTIEGRPSSPLRARIAVLSPYLPWPLAHGGAVRIYSLLREAARDFDIALHCFTEDAHVPDLGPLKDICHRITYVEKRRYMEPRWASLAPPEVCEYQSPAMQHALHGVHPLQVEYTQLAAYGGDILVEHDVTFDLYTQVHAQRRSLGSWWDLYRWRRFERRAVGRALPVVMSDKDARILGVAGSVVIGNGVDLGRFQPSPESPGRRLLFVGSFRHFPNISAFRWFWNEVWPMLKDCELVVVAGPEPLLHWRNHTGERDLPTDPRLNLHGFVADVKPLYDATNVVVVPTLVSAGTNLKVLEAMAMERAVVSTPSGIAGIGLTDNHDVLIAESPSDFALAIERLLSDVAPRASLTEAASRLAQANFSWKSLGEKQAALWHQFAPPPVKIEAGPSPTREFVAYPAYIARLIKAGSSEMLGHLTWRQLAAPSGGNPAECEILWLETIPAQRRQGIAERLLAHALDTNPGQWLLEVRASNIAAQALYARLGFRETGRRRSYYVNPEEDAILMTREASNADLPIGGIGI